MPIVGEWAWNQSANSLVGADYTVSWDLDFAPCAAFIKVFLGDLQPWDGFVSIGLINARFRDQNDVDQTVTFPPIGHFDSEFTYFNATMTHVTFGMEVYNAYANLVYTVEFWS